MSETASPVRVELKAEDAAYAPGDMIEGVVSWDAVDVGQTIAVALAYRVTGRGDTDEGQAHLETFKVERPSDARSFAFEAPNGPYSFRGVLFSLQWQIEAGLKGKHEVVICELVIAQSRTEIELPSL